MAGPPSPEKPRSPAPEPANVILTAKVTPRAEQARKTEEKQKPAARVEPVAELPASGTVVLDVESGVLVPSLIGKSMRAVIEQAQQAGLEIEAIGTGVASEQWPLPGTRMPAGRRIAVRFRR